MVDAFSPTVMETLLGGAALSALRLDAELEMGFSP